jgi:predicted dehydrogenase
VSLENSEIPTALKEVEMDSPAQGGFSRRKFLKKSAIGASALAVPAIVSPGVLGNDDVVRIGVIGCGGRGSADLQALVAVPSARIVAVCELREDRLERAKKIAYKSEPNGYKDFRQMLEKEKMDGVSVVVEVQNHAKVVVPVLEAGFNCFTEKPMDNTVEKVDAMVAAARRTGKWIQVGFQRRYIDGHRKVIERIHNEELGKIYALQGHWHFSHPAGPADADWDGGRLIEQACHHMDVMSWVMKSTAPERCIAMAMPPSNPGQNPPRHPSEAKSSVAWGFAGDVLFSYTHMFGMPGPFGDERGNQAGEKLWVICERGGYDITLGRKYVRGGGEKAEEQVGEPSSGYYDGTNQEWAAFVDCCRTGRLPDSNHETGRISTFMAIMGRMAMYDRVSRTFTPRLIRWGDLGSKTDPV